MKIIRKVKQELFNVLYKIYTRTSRVDRNITLNVPYVSQFAVPENAESTLAGRLDPLDDPNWRETGATSPEEYEKWAFTMCGMASTAMALGYFSGKKYKPVVLAEDALKHEVYALEERQTLSGMKYREFAEWIKKYGLKASIITRLDIQGIKHALSKGKLVMASVNPNIRGDGTAPVNQIGGHLVLIVGYSSNKGTISINNPSGYSSTNSQIKHELSIHDFKRHYAGRGIVLSLKEDISKQH